MLARPRALGEAVADPTVVARRCFEWVRDEIKHSSDHGLKAVTCTTLWTAPAATGNEEFGIGN